MSENDYVQNQQKGGLTQPVDDLQLAYLLTESSWGKEATLDLNEALKIIKEGKDEHGSDVYEYLWGTLSFYTKDFRLGNLTKEQESFCAYWTNLAGSCLSHQLKRSFLASLRLSITELELSQSRGGFFRKRQNTVTNEQIRSEITNPSQKGIFGGRKKVEEYSNGR